MDKRQKELFKKTDAIMEKFRLLLNDDLFTIGLIHKFMKQFNEKNHINVTGDGFLRIQGGGRGWDNLTEQEQASIKKELDTYRSRVVMNLEEVQKIRREYNNYSKKIEKEYKYKNGKPVKMPKSLSMNKLVKNNKKLIKILKTDPRDFIM